MIADKADDGLFSSFFFFVESTSNEGKKKKKKFKKLPFKMSKCFFWSVRRRRPLPRVEQTRKTECKQTEIFSFLIYIYGEQCVLHLFGRQRRRGGNKKLRSAQLELHFHVPPPLPFFRFIGVKFLTLCFIPLHGMNISAPWSLWVTR